MRIFPRTKSRIRQGPSISYDSFLTNAGNTNKTSMDTVEPTNTGLLEAKSLPHLWQLVWQSQTLSSEVTKATDCTSSSELKVWPRHLSENSRPWILEPGRLDTIQHFLCKLGMKPCMQLKEIIIFSLKHVIVRPTKIIKDLCKAST